MNIMTSPSSMLIITHLCILRCPTRDCQDVTFLIHRGTSFQPCLTTFYFYFSLGKVSVLLSLFINLTHLRCVI